MRSKGGAARETKGTRIAIRLLPANTGTAPNHSTRESDAETDHLCRSLTAQAVIRKLDNGANGPGTGDGKGPRKHDWEFGGWVQRWPIRCRPSRPIGGVGGRRPLDVVVLVTWGLTGPEPPDSLRLVGVASWRGHCELPDQPIVRAHILTRLGRFRSQSPAAGVAVGPRRFEHWTAPHLAP